jgi:hypothetical protein
LAAGISVSLGQLVPLSDQRSLSDGFGGPSVALFVELLDEGVVCPVAFEVRYGLRLKAA